MSALDKILDAVRNQISNRSQEGGAKSRGGGLFGRITDMLGSRTRARTSDRGFTNVRPASEDPLGDPADERTFRGQKVRPASEDPWGDPADEPKRRR
jgi:hypothetical protein